jgi:LemA protein
MVVVEAYPNLKANENFLSLQSQLEGTENRIKFERDNYNSAVKDYQVQTRQFPSNIIAGMFGFRTDKYEMFKAVAGSEIAPDVKELFNRE